MAKFKNFQFYNFSGGLDFKNSPPLISQTEKKVSWANAYNVELLQGGGVSQMKGSQLVAQLPENEKIIAGFESEQGENSFVVIVTDSGKLYQYIGGQFLLKYDKLTPTIKPNFKTYLNGVFVSNGIDEPFLFLPNHDPEILPANAITASGHKIKGKALEVYKGRIWIAEGASLYYSALGKYDDWASENDAGSISNFHNDTSKITALCCFKDVLVVHKEDKSFILSGNSPDNFVIQPFSDLGAISPYGITTANGCHVFFNKQIYPFLINDLGEIVQGSAISRNIQNKLAEFENIKNNECIFLNYKVQSQLWCFLYKTNEDYFNTIFIYDYANDAWLQRIVPYKITSAWLSGGDIYTGLSDGRLVVENVGTSFLGEPLMFSWSTPFFHFGQIQADKTIESLSLVFAANKDNNFKFQVRKNYSDYEIFDQAEFSNLNSNTLVFCDSEGKNGAGILDSDDVKYGFVTLPAQKIENYFANISGANKAVQIQLYGDELKNSLALLGLEFKEVCIDD